MQVQQPRAKEHTQFDYPTDAIVEYKETITQKLNYWRNKHIENIMAFHESLHRRKQDPTQVIPTQQGDLSITNICKIRLHPCLESKAHVEVLTAMLEEAKIGDDNLAERWNKETLIEPVDGIKSPLSDEMGGKGDDTETSKV